jgi:predicted DNA-binding protein
MTVTIDIPEEIEAQLVSEAQASGIPLAQFVHDFLLDHYEEREDQQIAETRLRDRQVPISANQVRTNLSVDD